MDITQAEINTNNFRSLIALKSTMRHDENQKTERNGVYQSLPVDPATGW
jgi:hypothetical protein